MDNDRVGSDGFFLSTHLLKKESTETHKHRFFLSNEHDTLHLITIMKSEARKISCSCLNHHSVNFEEERTCHL